MSWEVSGIGEYYGFEALEAFGAAEQPEYCRCLKACNEEFKFNSDGFAAKRNACYARCRVVNAKHDNCPEEYLDPWNKGTAVSAQGPGGVVTPAAATAPAVPGVTASEPATPSLLTRASSWIPDLSTDDTKKNGLPWYVWAGGAAVLLGGVYMVSQARKTAALPAMAGLGKARRRRRRR